MIKEINRRNPEEDLYILNIGLTHRSNLIIESCFQKAAIAGSVQFQTYTINYADRAFSLPNPLANKIIIANNLSAFAVAQFNHPHTQLLQAYFKQMSRMFKYEGEHYRVPADTIPVASDHDQILLQFLSAQ